MEVQFGPNSVDEPNLLYKLQRKIKVFNTSNPLPNRGYNLVACSSKYGLVFIGMPDGTLSVCYLAQLINEECDPQHFSVKLQESPTHIAVSCDNELLAVTGGQLLSIYRVTDFQHQNVAPSLTIKTDVNPSTFVSALQWNPCMPDSIAIAFHDGTLFACTAGNGQVKKVPSKARCICWSPKGKQLVTGNSDGTLCQYKPDLTPAKLIPAPKLFEGSPIETLAIYWISTYQFSVVYRNAADNSRPAVTIVTTPKGSQAMCINYEDICYSMGSNRPWYYYLQGLAQWNIILASSSNSMEIATVGSKDGVNWLQWSQATDETRAELPLTNKTQETYPTGISIDTCAIHQLPWGENETLPYMPLLHVISQSGLLTIFNIVNLNKQAPQLCSPPQQLALPATVMTSIAPDNAPAKPEPSPASAPAPEFKVQPQPVAPQVQAPQTQQFAGTNVTASATIKIPSYTPAPNQQPQQVTNSTSQLSEQKPVESTPVPTPQQTAPVQPKPQPPQKSQQAISQENAALKAEQERINKMKANQELKNMLIKEVNDFQMELYNFMVKTRETQARIQRDIDSINSNFNFNSLDTEQFKKECSIEDLRSAVVQLKLELVRACAVVAEARSHSDAKDFHEWTQADPLTTKRVASVKKLAYYVQTQLDQAHKALDYKWNELASKDPQYKGEPRMIRPILDDVYQPLVKQQEILSRQQAVLRTLRKTLNECEIGPVFKSTSLLRNTFKKDPLSKLTKNILNMSIEPKSPKTNQSLLTPQKLDALRDALSNHKTTKIKPVNVELRQHLANLRMNYEKSLREKAAPTVPVKIEPDVKSVAVKSEPPVAVKLEPKPEPMRQAVPKIEPNPEPVKQAVFAPVPPVKPAVANVARTLFTDEPKQETPKPSTSFKPTPTQPIAQNASTITKSVLKDLLQNKSQTNIEAKNDATFMGQKICSPTAFGQPSTAPPSMFTSKPIAEITNMFNKFQPQAIVPEKPQISNIKSSETGEPEATDTPKPFEFKPNTNLFGMKNTTPLNTASNVPDVLKTTIPEKKVESKVSVKPLDKLAPSKENVPETGEAKTVQKVEKKEIAKPFGVQGTNKSFVFGASTASNILSNDKPIDLKAETKSAESSKTVSNSSSASSITASETKSLDGSKASIKSESSTASSSASAVSAGSKLPTPTQQSASETSINAEESEKPVNTPESIASSIFSAAVASQPKTTSIFSTTGSIFGATTTASIFATTTKASAFSGGSIFSTATSSVFGQSSPTKVDPDSPSSIFANAVSTPTSVFETTVSESVATTASPVTTLSPVFDSSSATFAPTAATSTPTFATSSTSVFGTATVTTPSVFATTSTPSAFAPTTSSIFGTATTTASIFSSPTSQTSVFGATPGFGTTTTQASIFGSTQSTQASIFGQAPQGSVFGTPSPTTQASVFGTPTQTTQASVFGTQTTQASVFNSPTQTTQASVFGTPTQTTQASVFGTSTQTTQASVFGTPTQTTQASVFGTPTQTTQASVFGTPTPTTQPSLFGTPPQTTQASVFGTPTQTTQASVFGTPTQTTQASVFGTPTQTTQASVFGTPPQGAQSSVFGTTTTTQSGSLFGGTENLFAAASISTTNAPTPSSGGSIFGGGSSSPGSVFGGTGTNVFGSKTTFGQPNATAASIFGSGGATTFGDQSQQKQFFWGSGNNSSTGFGSSAFGQPATTQSSIFGGTTGGSFSAPSAGAFGTPQGSFGSESPKPSVFGSPQQQTSPAFGGSPSFGTKPVFGQTPGFGSPTSGGFGAPAFGGFNKSPTSAGFGGPASFGGGSAFGGQAFGNTSPGKMFKNTPGFGSPTQSNAMFENLATQNTMTFGNLAQQSGQPQPQSPSFNASPSFTEWRG